MSTPSCLLRISLAQAQKEHVTYVMAGGGTGKYIQFVDILLHGMCLHMCGFFHISMSDMWSYGSSGRECFGIQYVCLGMYFGVHVYIAV